MSKAVRKRRNVYAFELRLTGKENVKFSKIKHRTLTAQDKSSRCSDFDLLETRNRRKT